MRKKIEGTPQETNVGLDKLIPLYGKTKAQEAEYKKAAEIQNKRIKDLMRKMKNPTKTVDGWTATFSIRTSSSFNMEALLEFVKSHKEFASCIKTKEYVDETVLEDLLFTNKIPKKLIIELDKFKTEKKTEVLNIKKEEE